MDSSLRPLIERIEVVFPAPIESVTVHEGGHGSAAYRKIEGTPLTAELHHGCRAKP
jgi:hypothetical protein